MVPRIHQILALAGASLALGGCHADATRAQSPAPLITVAPDAAPAPRPVESSPAPLWKGHAPLAEASASGAAAAREPLRSLAGSLPAAQQGPEPDADREEEGGESAAPALEAGVHVDSLGPIVIVPSGESQLSFRPLGVEMRDARERIVAVREPSNSGRAGRTFAADAYGPGLDLRVRATPSGGLVRLVHLRHPLAMPEEAMHIDVRESLAFDPGLALFDEDGRIEVGATRRTFNGLSLRGGDGEETFHIPAANAWDAAGGDVPWMSYEVELVAPGHALLATRLPAAWLRDETRSWPVHIDPTVHPLAPPPPVVASFLMAPVTPGAQRVSLAAVFGNFYGDEMRVRTNWGDGTIELLERRAAVQLVHRYDAPGVYDIQFQVCDGAQPPNCARVARWVPAGTDDCSSIDGACLEFSYDSELGRCVATQPDPDCAPCENAAADCRAGQFCDLTERSCANDCTQPGARPCEIDFECADSGDCVPIDLRCADGAHDCVASATCVPTGGGFVCACPGGQLGDGRASGSGCNRLKAGGVASVGGISQHASSATARRVRGALVVLLSAALPALNPTQETAALHYEGELSTLDGAPIDDIVTLSFAIYNDATAGDALWAETVEVLAEDGHFRVRLGADTPMDLRLWSEMTAGAQRWLSLSIAPDGELLPQQRFHYLPLAISATSVQPGGVGGEAIADGAVQARHLSAELGAGVEGPVGEVGPRGASCTTVSIDETTAEITCTDGRTTRIALGADAAGSSRSCTATDNGDGTGTVTCPDGTRLRLAVPLCGDGVVAGAEECDAGGETADCNSRCELHNSRAPLVLFSMTAVKGRWGGGSPLEVNDVCNGNALKPPGYRAVLFASVNQAHEIRDLPQNYGFSRDAIVQGPTGIQIASEWSDLLDGSITHSLADAEVMPSGTEWWSGSSTVGGRDAQRCSGWTSTASHIKGRVGRSTSTSGAWLKHAARQCNVRYRRLCLAFPE